MLQKEGDRAGNKIVKIHGIGRKEPPGIFLIHLADAGAAVVVGELGLAEILRRADAGIFAAADLTHHRAGRKLLFVQLQILQDPLDETLAVAGVVNGEVITVAQFLTVPAQDAHTGGVKGAGPDVVGTLAQHPLQTRLQLIGSLVGEGDGQDPPGSHRLQRGQSLRLRSAREQAAQGVLVRAGGQLIAVAGPAIAEKIGNAVDEHRGLPAACPCQNQQGALCGQDRFHLAVVQVLEFGADQTAPRFAVSFRKVHHAGHSTTKGRRRQERDETVAKAFLLR